jgi:ATP:ADP antiporter, AAA family
LPNQSVENDNRVTWIAATLLFFVIAAFIVLKSARDALILSEYSAQALPYFMVLTTLAVGLLVAVYLRFQTRLSLCRAAGISLIVFSLGTMALWAGIIQGRTEWIPALYVWVGVFGAVAPMQAWSIISRRLMIRQAKRAIGFIGGGGVAGSIAGGLLAERLADWISVPALLPAAALAMLAALIPVSALGFCKTVMDDHLQQPGQERPLRKRFVYVIVLIVGAGTVVSTFADFQFKVIAQRDLQTAASLAVFFGWFYAYLGVATLLFQVLITPLLLQRVDLAVALSILPIAFLAGNSMILVFGALWSAILLRGGEQLFKHSIDRSSLEVLYTAVPGIAKLRLKAMVDALGVRLSESAAALVLVLLFSVAELPLQAISIISLAVVAVWVAGTISLKREYPELLEEVIERREISVEDLKSALFRPSFYHLLPKLAQTSDRQTLILLLELLSTGQQRRVFPYLAVLLGHPDAEIRRRTIHLLFAHPADLSHLVEPLLDDRDSTVRSEAVHYLCSRSAKPQEKLALFLDAADPATQVAACSCSLQHQTDSGRAEAVKRLEQLLTDAIVKDRREIRLEIAHVLEHLESAEVTERLYLTLFRDPSPEVRHAAVRAITRNHPSTMVPVLIESWRDPALWADARTALASYGEELLPQIEQVLSDPQTQPEAGKLLLQVASDIGGDRAVTLLCEAAGRPHLTLRYAALKGLNRLSRRRSPDRFRETFEDLLSLETRTLSRDHEMLFCTAPKPSGLLEKLLLQRLYWTEERIFRVLGLLYEPQKIYHAYHARKSNAEELADKAMELLSAVLNTEHRRLVLPLLDQKQQVLPAPLKPERRLELFQELCANQDVLPAVAILAEMNSNELGSWHREIRQLAAAVADDGLLLETLEWRLSEMGMTSGRQPGHDTLTTVQKLESLSRVEIFSRLGAHELLVLAHQSIEVRFEAGEIIFSEGEEAHNIYSLLDGEVELQRSDHTLRTIEPGGSFGTLAVLSGQPRFATARARRSSLCLKIERESFWDMIEDYPQASRSVFEVLALQIHQLMDPTA